MIRGRTETCFVLRSFYYDLFPIMDENALRGLGHTAALEVVDGITVHGFGGDCADACRVVRRTLLHPRDEVRRGTARVLGFGVALSPDGLEIH